MCRGPTQPAPSNRPRLLLASVESFSQDGKNGPPRAIEMVTTIAIIISALIAIEYSMTNFLTSYQVSPGIVFDRPSLNLQSNRIYGCAFLRIHGNA